jgi:hypothetical protein
MGYLPSITRSRRKRMPTINLPDGELAAVTAAIRGVIAGDRYPHAPRLDPLRAALARLEAAVGDSVNQLDALPRMAPAGKGEKRGRRS